MIQEQKEKHFIWGVNPTTLTFTLYSKEMAIELIQVVLRYIQNTEHLEDFKHHPAWIEWEFAILKRNIKNPVAEGIIKKSFPTHALLSVVKFQQDILEEETCPIPRIYS